VTFGHSLPLDESLVRDTAGTEHNLTEVKGPMTTGSEIVAVVLEAARRHATKAGKLRRVVIGDLQSLRSFADQDDVFQAVGVLTTFFRTRDIPVILYETAPSAAGMPLPRVVDFADVSIEVIPALTVPRSEAHYVMTDRTTGRQTPTEWRR
jgi:hypothetical protein